MNKLDEMQREKRNRFGNQSLFLMFYLLMLDCALYGLGLRWLEYPANVMVIITLSMGVYLVRIIAGNAYLPPESRPARLRGKIIVVFAVLVAVVAAFLSGGLDLTESKGDNSALIMFGISAVALLIALIIFITRAVRDKKEEE